MKWSRNVELNCRQPVSQIINKIFALDARENNRSEKMFDIADNMLLFHEHLKKKESSFSRREFYCIKQCEWI